MLVATDVFGSPLSFGQCVRTIRPMAFEAVASHLSMLCQFSEGAFDAVPLDDRAQVPDLCRLLRLMFSGDHLERVYKQLATMEGRFAAVSTQEILATIELAGRYCPRRRADFHLTDEERLRVSHILLSFQDEALSSSLRRQFRDEQITDWKHISERAVYEFIRNMAAHNPGRPYAGSLSRLHAYATKRSIGEFFKKRTGREVARWFEENLGMSPNDYLRSAFVVGAAATRFSIADPNPNHLAFDPEEFFAPFPAEARTQVRTLLQVATKDGLQVWDRPAAEEYSLDGFLYGANALHATPVISFGQRHVLVSSMLLWNLFACGLPHASLNAVRQRTAQPLEKKQVSGIRGEFGCMFEGYVQWLFHEWFAGQPVLLFQNYEVNVGGRWAERDVAIIREDCAFVFEAKANVIDLEFRRCGTYAGLARFIAAPLKQAFEAAEALLKGEARDSRGRAIGRVSRVIPVALVYDPIPLNLFTGDHVEPWLERLTKLPLFAPAHGRERALLLNIEELESAESALRMDRDPLQLLAAIFMRGVNPMLRYERLNSLEAAIAGPKRPAPVACLAYDTDQYLAKLPTMLNLPVGS